MQRGWGPGEPQMRCIRVRGSRRASVRSPKRIGRFWGRFINKTRADGGFRVRSPLFVLHPRPSKSPHPSGNGHCHRTFVTGVDTLPGGGGESWAAHCPPALCICIRGNDCAPGLLWRAVIEAGLWRHSKRTVGSTCRPRVRPRSFGRAWTGSYGSRVEAHPTRGASWRRQAR